MGREVSKGRRHHMRKICCLHKKSITGKSENANSTAPPANSTSLYAYSNKYLILLSSPRSSIFHLSATSTGFSSVSSSQFKCEEQVEAQLLHPFFTHSPRQHSPLILAMPLISFNLSSSSIAYGRYTVASEEEEDRKERVQESDEENEDGGLIQFASFDQADLCQQLTKFIAKNVRNKAKDIRLVLTLHKCIWHDHQFN